MNYCKPITRINKLFLLILRLSLLLSVLLVGCGGSPSAEVLETVDYAPITTDIWPVSTPEEQGLDPNLVAELYNNAEQLPTVYSLLVFKNGYLIAEDYFNGGSPDRQSKVQSVTKSITSALVGIAIEEGCLTGVDQKMMDFFPEYADQVTDPRKFDITIQQMLQMRAGYPWEESTPELMDLLFSGFHNDTLVQVPLVRDPGSDSEYSNLTPHILGMIVARACDTDLRSFAIEHLFGPLGIEPGFWQQDWDGNYLGFADLDLSSTDLAKFGLMIANDGVYDGKQIVPADWVEESLQSYSKRTWKFRVGPNWKANEYGYQWWSIKAGSYRYHLAWGHGGQQIAIVDDLDLMVVLLADALYAQHGDDPWKIEKGNLNLVADFIASLPASGQ
ncbi:MAG: serine hydrolase domain-containing protein [Anaerolineales bacterium]